MEVRTALTTIAWRAAVSAIAGLLVSAFAAAVLTFGPGASSDRLAVGRTISDSLAPLFSAVAGAGLVASIVVFACLVTNDVLRALGRWLAAQRRWFVLLFRGITWLVAQVALAIVAALQAVARSTVVAEALWLVRTVGKAVGWGVISFTVLVGCAIPYFGAITVGVVTIGESTRIVVAMLDDPPPPMTMALGLGSATALMYIGLAAFAFCAWVSYQAARAGARAAARHVGTVAS